MDLPNNYDAVTLAVHPVELQSAGKAIAHLCTEVADALETISKSLSELKLSWAGDSAGSADEFNSRWQAAVFSLFGSTNDPQSGVLNVLVSGVATAAQNYDSIEHQIAMIFSAFGKPTGSKDAGYKNVIDAPSGRLTPGSYLFHTTSVNETGFTS